jgi:hypothetical protein
MDKTLALAHEPPRCPAFEAWRISPDGYVQYWPEIERALDKVPHIWQTHWTKESLYEGAMSGRFQVWGFGASGLLNVIVFTQVAEFPAARILEIFLAFGNSLDSALPVMEATFEKFAQVTGCQTCEIIGRRGWARKLPRFKEHRTVLRWDVENYGVH